MQRFIQGVLCALAAFACVACGSDSTTSPSSGVGSSSGSGGGSASARILRASYDGTAWTATTAQGVWLPSLFSVSGNDGQGRELVISAVNIPGPGTYSLAPGNPNSALAQWVDSNRGQFSSEREGGSGTLVVTAASSTRVAGTFSFVATFRSSVTSPLMTVTVTNGQFDLSIP